MRRRWVGKNVNLALLSESVEDFFRSKGFKTRKNKSGDEYTIIGRPQYSHEVREGITVRILGNPNDFVIEITTKERARSSILLGFITTFIGGGNLLLRGLRSQEALEKLEREFWIYAEDAVAHSIGSDRR